MSIKQHFENALKNIEADKERAIATAREKVTREKIIPNNSELDRLRAEAINARTAQLNQDIAKLQETFASERQAIIEASEKKKTDFANQVISVEIAVVEQEYNNAITVLKKQISEIKE